MESKKIFFILSLLGILTLMFIGNFKEFQVGTIKDIKISNTKTTIYLYENQTQLIIFDSNINLQKNDLIKFQGKENTYKGQKQTILEKVYQIKK